MYFTPKFGGLPAVSNITKVRMQVCVQVCVQVHDGTAAQCRLLGFADLYPVQ